MGIKESHMLIMLASKESVEVAIFIGYEKL